MSRAVVLDIPRVDVVVDVLVVVTRPFNLLRIEVVGLGDHRQVL